MSWAGQPHVSVVMLNRLGRSQAASLVEESPPAARFRRKSSSKSSPMPTACRLFVEELTKTVLVSGAVAQEARRTATELRPPVVVPSSLHASLMSRLDRLASVKEVAQMGAVIGREFSFETFLAAFHLPRDLAAGSLRALVDGDVMVERGRPPNAVYSFKHALMQDAAYGSLLRDRRRALHLQVAEMLGPVLATRRRNRSCWRTISPRRASPDRAIDYHLKAAEQAMARCAIAEMVSHLRRGLRLLQTLPDGPATRRRELLLQAALGRGPDRPGRVGQRRRPRCFHARARAVPGTERERTCCCRSCTACRSIISPTPSRKW